MDLPTRNELPIGTARTVLLWVVLDLCLLLFSAGRGDETSLPTPSAVPAPASAESKITLWDGLTAAGGNGRTFVGHTPGIAESTVTVVPSGSEGPKKQVIRWQISGKDWIMMAWGGLGPAGGYPCQGWHAIRLRIKVTGKVPPPDLLLRIQASSEDEGATAHFVDLGKYSEHLMDGQWHNVTVPLADIYQPHPVGKAIDQFQLGLMTGVQISCTIDVDKVSLDR